MPRDSANRKEPAPQEPILGAGPRLGVTDGWRAVIPALQQVLLGENGVSGNVTLHEGSGDGTGTQESGDSQSYCLSLVVR